MNHTVLSRAIDVTLKARLRGQFAALDFLPRPDTADHEAVRTIADSRPAAPPVITAPHALASWRRPATS